MTTSDIYAKVSVNVDENIPLNANKHTNIIIRLRGRGDEPSVRVAAPSNDVVQSSPSGITLGSDILPSPTSVLTLYPNPNISLLLILSYGNNAIIQTGEQVPKTVMNKQGFRPIISDTIVRVRVTLGS